MKDYWRATRKTGPFAGARSLLALEKTRTRAVDDISFNIGPGEVVGYLGPNGAGKSTTIKMLTGILVPTSGTVEVNGAVPWRDRKRNAQNIGVVFGQRSQLWYDLPLRDSFELIRKLYGISKDDYQKRLDKFADLLNLGAFIDTPVRSLSLGQRMRGDLTAAMLYEPPLIYLDEPTVGLDVVAKASIREFIAESNKDQGTTVMLTTHDLSDVERLCTRILLIDHGQLLYDGDLSTLRRLYAPYRELVMTISDSCDLRPVPNATVVSVAARGNLRVLTYRYHPLTASAPDVVAAVAAGHNVADLTIVEPDLEDVIKEIYRAGEVKVR